MATTIEQARDLYKRGDLPGALAAFERAIELLPEDPEPCFSAGVIKDKLKEPEAAVAFFEQALGRRASYGKAYVNLAAVHAEQGRFFEARQVIQKGLDIGDKAQHRMLEELLSQVVAGICVAARDARARADAALTANQRPTAPGQPPPSAPSQGEFARLLSGLSALSGDKLVESELVRDDVGEPTFLIQGERRKYSAQLGPAGSILMIDAEEGAIVTQIVLEPDAKWATGKFGPEGTPGAPARKSQG